MNETLEQQLLRHEGLRLKPYRCPAGYLTIAVGRNLDVNGISKNEAMLMLHNDIDRVRNEVADKVPWAVHMLSLARLDVLHNMAFNIGINGLVGYKHIRGFERMLAALKSGDYDLAAKELLDSKYARQVGDRAGELAEQMRTGLLREK